MNNLRRISDISIKRYVTAVIYDRLFLECTLRQLTGDTSISVTIDQPKSIDDILYPQNNLNVKVDRLHYDEPQTYCPVFIITHNDYSLTSSSIQDAFIKFLDYWKNVTGKEIPLYTSEFIDELRDNYSCQPCPF